jgi:hypothetical protein
VSEPRDFYVELSYTMDEEAAHRVVNTFRAVRDPFDVTSTTAVLAEGGVAIIVPDAKVTAYNLLGVMLWVEAQMVQMMHEPWTLQPWNIQLIDAEAMQLHVNSLRGAA